MRSGYIAINYSNLLSASGNGGYSWPSTGVILNSATSATAYYFGFNTHTVHPSNGADYRWLGFSLRCLASAGGTHTIDTVDHLMDSQ